MQSSRNKHSTGSTDDKSQKRLRKSRTLNLMHLREARELQAIETNTRNFLVSLSPSEGSEVLNETNEPQLTRCRSSAIYRSNRQPTLGIQRCNSPRGLVVPEKETPMDIISKMTQTASPASSPISKRLRTQSIIDSNSLFQARRITVTLGEHNDKFSSNDDFLPKSVTDSSILGFDISKEPTDDIEKLREKLDKALSIKWETELFRRFLRQNHIDQVLDFYMAIRKFPRKLQVFISGPNFTGNPKEELLEQSLLICSRFEYTLPKGLRKILSTIISPMLLINSTGNAEKRNSMNSSEDEHYVAYEACEEYFDFDADDQNYHMDPFDEETMAALDIEDKYLYKKSTEHICGHMRRLLSGDYPVKLVARMIFLLAERKVYRVLLEDLYPDFICSHNQLYTIESRSYSTLSSLTSEELETPREVSRSESVTEEDDLKTIKSTDASGDIVIDAAHLRGAIRSIFGNTGELSSKFRHCVVICFQYFTTLQELLNELTKYLSHLKSAEEKSNGVLSVTNFVKQIIDQHSQFLSDKENTKIILSFVKETLNPISPPCGQLITKLLVKMVNFVPKTVELQFQTKPPKIKATKSELEKLEHSLQLLYISPLELARQLAIRDFKMFQQISMEECLHMRWTKSQKDNLAPNIICSIRQFCNLGYWIASEIVQEKSLGKRVKMLGKAIRSAYHSLLLGNFNGAMSISSGLQNHSIFRLTVTWAELPEKTMNKWNSLQEAFKCDKNYAALRLLIRESKLPAVPYLGMFLSDLTFISNENNFLEDNPRMINFVKMLYIGCVTLELRRFQDTPYCLQEIESVQSHLRYLVPPDEDALYEMSIKHESREFISKAQKPRNSRSKFMGFL